MRLALAALTALTLLVHGYHPFAEDGGLYVAGIQYTLDPRLFPHYTAFVTEHLRFSLFAPVLAAIVRRTHLSLQWTLFLTDLFSITLMLYSGRKLLQRCINNEAAQFTGVCLLAAFWTLPIAGTSLLLMDPYVTARSLSTPLSLLAIAYALDPWRRSGLRQPRRRLLTTESSSFLGCAISLLAAGALHPLMAAYALAFVITLRVTRLRQRLLAWAMLTLAALALAATVLLLSPAESPAVVAASYSRYYWFLSQWQWFELLGLLGPMVIFAALLHWRRHQLTEAAATLLRAGLALGTIAVIAALLFAHESYSTHLVARLQPLRVFLLLYAVMALLLGATLAQLVRNGSVRALVLLALFGTMFYVQRSTFPASPHIEFPGRTNQNPWVEAFMWARNNTPTDALFALDTKYVNEDGEDAQTFRAWSLRSALPDFSKDGGEAAITPVLAETWQQGAAAQRNLSTESDGVRDIRLLHLGATWMLLHSSAVTAHTCPYNNGTVKVCELLPD